MIQRLTSKDGHFSQTTGVKRYCQNNNIFFDCLPAHLFLFVHLSWSWSRWFRLVLLDLSAFWFTVEWMSFLMWVMLICMQLWNSFRAQEVFCWWAISFSACPNHFNLISNFIKHFCHKEYLIISTNSQIAHYCQWEKCIWSDINYY